MSRAAAADHEFAHRLADEAGRVLLEVRADTTVAAADRGNAGDQRSAEYLLARLAAERPDDAVLMEDARNDESRATATRVWIVDPLDGTREFGEGGREDWAVHVALWESGEITAAAVGLPARGAVLSTMQPPALPHRAGENHLRIAVSRSRPAPFAQALGESLGAELVPIGSAGFKTAAVLLGDVDAYVHAGGQYEWDTAAPAGVAMAVGAHASRVDGSVLRYNQPNPWLPDVLVCRRELADDLLSRIATLSAG